MNMYSETHHMFVQILICVSAAQNNSLMQYTFTSINLCIWEQNLEQKILANFNSMMAVGVSCSTSLESTTVSGDQSSSLDMPKDDVAVKAIKYMRTVQNKAIRLQLHRDGKKKKKKKSLIIKRGPTTSSSNGYHVLG